MQFRHIAGETNVWDCYKHFFHSISNSQDRARMPRSGKHVSGSSLDLSSERTGYVEVIGNLMMPQFKSTVFIWSLCGDNLVPVQSVDLHDECEQHACAQKGSSMASSVVNRPGDVGTLKCAFLTKYFDSVCFLGFTLWCVLWLLSTCVFKTENQRLFWFLTEIPFLFSKKLQPEEIVAVFLNLNWSLHLCCY